MGDAGGRTEESRRDYEQYAAQLAERPAKPPAPRPNFEAVQAVLAQDFRAVYDTLPDAEKRSVWHSIIKEIRVNNSLEITHLVFYRHGYIKKMYSQGQRSLVK